MIGRPRKPGSIGYPAWGVEMAILDAEDMGRADQLEGRRPLFLGKIRVSNHLLPLAVRHGAAGLNVASQGQAAGVVECQDHFPAEQALDLRCTKTNRLVALGQYSGGLFQRELFECIDFDQ